MNKNFSTADLCDDFPGEIQFAGSGEFKNFGKKKTFSGKIYTVKCYENNPYVRKALEESGSGRVLIVDGGGSLQCALLGDMLCSIAIQNGWEGIIVNGCIRDSAVINGMNIGIKALNTNPMKSGKKNSGAANVEVEFAGLRFNPNEYVYCDEDGIVISKNELILNQK